MIDSGLRIGYVVFARSEARLAAATLASLTRQTRRPDFVVLSVPNDRRHVFERSDQHGAHFASTERIAWRYEDNERTMALRAMAGRAEVAVFVSEGLVLEPRHCANLAKGFEDHADAVARLEVVDKCLPVKTRSPLDDLPSQIADSPLRRAYRRLFRPRLSMQSVLALRLRAARGLEFERLGENCDWLAYTLFQRRLHRRGGLESLFSDDVYQVRPQPDQRWRYETSYDVYRALFRLAGTPDAAVVNSRVEVARFLIDLVEESLILRQKRWPIGRMLQGMLAARRDVKATRRAVDRDIKEIGFG